MNFIYFFDKLGILYTWPTYKVHFYAKNLVIELTLFYAQSAWEFKGKIVRDVELAASWNYF